MNPYYDGHIEENGNAENRYIRKNGKSYKILPINDNKEGKSLLEDVPYITANITTREIVGLIRESRAGI